MRSYIFFAFCSPVLLLLFISILKISRIAFQSVNKCGNEDHETSEESAPREIIVVGEKGGKYH